ncbi:hypothetical protein [Parapedobacter pyrenivorans]|nr:hypothetical protein [Parapedobacter pyrenivorans]
MIRKFATFNHEPTNMKRASGILAYLSLLLNIAYLSLWIGVFNAYEGRPFEEVKAKFESFMPFSHGWTVFLLILLSVFSLIILARKPAVLPKILAVLQSFFVFMYIWQFL